MVCFGAPWGFVENERDERGINHSFRVVLDPIGFITRFAFIRDHVMKLPLLKAFLLPSPTAKSGWGYLIGCARK